MVRDTQPSKGASTHQIRDSYLKEYRRYAPDTKQGDGPCADPEGDRGPGPPPALKYHKNIGFLNNTGPDPLKKQYIIIIIIILLLRYTSGFRQDESMV